MIITMIIILTITIIIKPSSSSSLGRPACSFHLENGNDCTNPSLSRSQAAVAPLCPPGCHYRKVHLAFEQLLHVEQLEHLQRHGHLEHLHCFCTLSILSTLVRLRSCPRVITSQSVRKADTGQYSLQQQEWFKQGWLKLDITSVYDPLLQKYVAWIESCPEKENWFDLQPGLPPDVFSGHAEKQMCLGETH